MIRSPNYIRMLERERKVLIETLHQIRCLPRGGRAKRLAHSTLEFCDALRQEAKLKGRL